MWPSTGNQGDPAPAERAPQVSVRDYKHPDLRGATLLASVPHTGIGSSLLTDYVLEQFGMDQVACLDSPWFPPLAIVRAGRPRFPARIHADAKRRLAVLRCEFHVAPFLARPAAMAILGWAQQNHIENILTLDGIQSLPSDDGSRGDTSLFFLGSTPAARKKAGQARLKELPEGALGGVPAMLLLESRFLDLDCIGLVAEISDGLEDARSTLAFAKALGALIPGFHLDPKGLEAGLTELDQTVRRVRDEATAAMERLDRMDATPQPMYG